MESSLHSDGVLPALNWNVLGGPLEIADQYMETLRAVSLQFLHHPHPTRRFLYRESVSSCRLAGSKATLLDLLCYEEAPEFLAPNPGVREQSQYLAALDIGLERLRRGSLDAGIIQDCFERLCPEAKLPSAIAEQILNHAARTEGLHPLLQAGLLHAHFAIAEPFPAASDRMTRLLSALFLADRKGIKAPGLFLSSFFEKHAETYGRHLRSLAEGADPTDWLAFFVEGARHQAVDTTQRIQVLLDLMDRYRAIMVRQGKGTPVSLQGHGTPGECAPLHGANPHGEGRHERPHRPALHPDLGGGRGHPGADGPSLRSHLPRHGPVPAGHRGVAGQRRLRRNASALQQHSRVIQSLDAIRMA